MFIFLIILLILALIIEGSLTTLPLSLICLLCLTIIRRDAMVFVIAFIAGIFLDIFTLRQLGGTSIFLLTFVLLILLYQRKYEIYSYYFVTVASFIGALLFSAIFGYTELFIQAVLSAFIAVALFAGIKLIAKMYDGKQESKVTNYAKR